MDDNDLVFLVQMTGGSTAGRDKSIINAHISKQTHSRRKRERTLQAQSTQDLANIHEQASASCRSSLLSGDTNLQTVVGHHSPNSRQVVGYESRHTSLSPPTPAGMLNSLEGLDEKAEEYLQFGRAVLEPAIHNVGYRGWTALGSPREEYVGPDLLAGRTFPYDNLHIHRADCFRVFVFAVLAYCASGFAAVNQVQHAHHDAINYTISCMKSLREYLNNLNHDINDISEDLIYRLFRAEVLANNHSSASAHGKLLRKIFEHKAYSSSLRLDILSNTLYQDSHRAFNSWSRPIFDQEWVRQQYQHEWQQASAMFNVKQEEGTHFLGGCVKDHLLRSYLLAARKLLLETQTLTRRAQSATPSNFFWFASQCEWLQMCLMDYYLDREQRSKESDDVLHGGDLGNLNLCISLATLYVLRHAKNDVHIRGQPLFQGCKNIYLRMDAQLGALARAMNTTDSEQNFEAIVFMLYVAAVAEDHHLRFNTTSNVAYAWRRRLGQYLVANDVTTWEALSGILSVFPYTEQELPNPSVSWFQEVIEEVAPG